MVFLQNKCRTGSSAGSREYVKNVKYVKYGFHQGSWPTDPVFMLDVARPELPTESPANHPGSRYSPSSVMTS